MNIQGIKHSTLERRKIMLTRNCYDECQWQKDIVEVQEMYSQFQEDMEDLEYRAVNKKREIYRLWRMV